MAREKVATRCGEQLAVLCYNVCDKFLVGAARVPRTLVMEVGRGVARLLRTYLIAARLERVHE